MEKQTRNRTISWYLKLALASCAVAFGLFLFAGIVALPFVGFKLLDWQMTPEGGNALSILTLLVLPFVYRGLK